MICNGATHQHYVYVDVDVSDDQNNMHISSRAYNQIKGSKRMEAHDPVINSQMGQLQYSEGSLTVHSFIFIKIKTKTKAASLGIAIADAKAHFELSIRHIFGGEGVKKDREKSKFTIGRGCYWWLS